MSHLRPEDRPKPSKASCRKGRHHYGAAQKVGGGISRQVCEVCGEVSIDLRDADALKEPVLRPEDKVQPLSLGDS